MHLKVLFLMAFCLSLGAAVIQVAPGTLTVPILENFDSFAGGGGAGTNYDIVLVANGVSVAERFMGQTLSYSGDFDVLGSSASGPLALQLGLAGRNVGINTYGPGNVVYGLGPLGYPDFNAVGEGALAFLFGGNQLELGFDVVGSNGGSMTLAFFRSDGSLINALVIDGLTDGAYAFRSDAGAEIAGFSLYNGDLGGIGYDNLRAAFIPEPSTLGLAAIGLFAVLARIRTRRSGTH